MGRLDFEPGDERARFRIEKNRVGSSDKIRIFRVFQILRLVRSATIARDAELGPPALENRGDDRLVAPTSRHRDIVRGRRNLASQPEIGSEGGFPRVLPNDRGDRRTADFAEFGAGISSHFFVSFLGVVGSFFFNGNRVSAKSARFFSSW